MHEIIEHYIKLISPFGTVRTSTSIYGNIDLDYRTVDMQLYANVADPEMTCEQNGIDNCYATRLYVTPGCNIMFNITLSFDHPLVKQYMLKECSYAALIDRDLHLEYDPAVFNNAIQSTSEIEL